MALTPSFEGTADVSPSARGSRASRETIVTVVILALWLALVVFTTTRHEFWRDEVRALTLSRQADSPLDLYRLLRDDGHPLLWYVLLFTGTSIVDSPVVLPIVSVLIALAAVALFMRVAPFPLWLRCIFIFSALPVFEYSVMARNYGVSMLLFFVAAILYRTRATHPYRLALALALLANTNVHSTMLTCLFAAAWVWDIALDQKRGRIPAGFRQYLPLALVGIGVLVCAAVTLPREDNVLTPVRESPSVGAVVTAIRGAVLRPDLTFPDLIPSWLRPKPTILLLYGAIVGLILRPNLFLAALAAQTVLGVFFRIVYPGWYRHQGLYLLFLVFLYWVFIESAAPRAWSGVRRLVFRGGLYGAVLALVLVQLGRAPRTVWADITGTKSASEALGEYLNGSPHLRNAVIVPEPDFTIEALPYYAGHRIYLPRENRFGTTVSWTSDAKARFSLGELLRAARDVKARTGHPVLIVLGPFDFSQSGEQQYLYGKAFTWSAAEVEEFRRATTPLREFEATEGDEDYRVFMLDGA